MMEQISNRILPFACLIVLLSGIPLVFEPSAYNIIREESYFYLLALVSLIYISVSFLFGKAKLSLHMNRGDLFFLLFILYVVLRSILISPHKIPQDNFLYLFLLVIFYLLFKHQVRINKAKMAGVFASMLIFIGFFETIYAYLQLFNVIPHLAPVFKFSGTFGNPAPLSIILSSINIILFNSLLNSGKGLKQVKKILIYVFLLLSVVLIAMARIRSSWIALGAGVFVILFIRFNVWKRFNELQVYKRSIIVLGCCVLVFVLFIGLLSFKTDSALGRVFIWKNTIALIQDQPVFGVGYNNFVYYYNDYQSKAFIEGNYSEKDYFTADNVGMAFNDYLQITAEYGLIGILLFLALLYYISKSFLSVLKHGNYFITGIGGVLIAILCASLFSYPLTVNRIQVLFVLCLAIVSGHDESNVFSAKLSQAGNKSIGTAFTIVCIVVLVFQSIEYKNFRKWNNAKQSYERGFRPEALQKYHRLYNNFKDYFFLYNYSSALDIAGSYPEAIYILDEAGEYFNNYEYYMDLGNYYLKYNKPGSAEVAFSKALTIIPSRIMPRFGLFQCAVEEQNNEKIQSAGKEVLECKIKINSALTDTIRYEVAKYLDKENIIE